MSNALFEIYGRASSSPWFPRLRRIHCPRPDKELKDLDGEFPGEGALYFLCANRGISYIGISGTRADGGLFRRLRHHWRTPQKHFQFVYAFGLPASELAPWEAAAIAHFRPEQNWRGRKLFLGHNDDLAGLAAYMAEKEYFSLFPRTRRFRIDVGAERPAPTFENLSGDWPASLSAASR
jgi:hypothetical protein